MVCLFCSLKTLLHDLDLWCSACFDHSWKRDLAHTVASLENNSCQPAQLVTQNFLVAVQTLSATQIMCIPGVAVLCLPRTIAHTLMSYNYTFYVERILIHSNKPGYRWDPSPRFIHNIFNTHMLKQKHYSCKNHIPQWHPINWWSPKVGYKKQNEYVDLYLCWLQWKKWLETSPLFKICRNRGVHILCIRKSLWL